MKQLTDYEHKLTWVQGLLIDCPFGPPLSDCPASELRKLPITDRLSIAQEMSEPELDRIISHHRNCLAKREYHN
ncbi:MAG: hypothetical protein HQ509_11595 [Candidatus Marinimicrobia bacterium]|nr:hypothetical protein [Candidatus Neomarinimicrobiota bacterium]